ncbi:MAG: dihydropteroate synthase [Rhodospirillaceae bacterium]|jgi:dihydropteroate synthase|nr:dihydropteroate synthase [Rhodospirillaceae bacterium]MBT3886868.1 dihydropteroate synthase [Rhodospirillaceae bacterium]MBT4116679.1 dihydropteroate synthase [Rhodospirillaceae bacterium]MBT4721786.1 dihydropteroate synthase [Rhodospirillaceae bacterium]MBT4751967.1 dihydropteroate synthase [Rhodospirillaceae bacterium]
MMFAGLDLGRPLIMGIVNVTPDSFSDGGEAFDAADAIERGLALIADGADIIDVGGESTRHGAEPVAPKTEAARVLPVITALAKAGAVVSIDSRHASVMGEAVQAGAAIINDVSALSFDANALRVAADTGASVILMHMKGTPQTMAGMAEYDDVVAEVCSYLRMRIDVCIAAGIERTRICIDPGFGFAKRMKHNYELLDRLPEIAAIGPTVCAGLSRKFGKTENPKERLDISIDLARRAVSGGARIIRVHDVAATVAGLAEAP